LVVGEGFVIIFPAILGLVDFFKGIFLYAGYFLIVIFSVDGLDF
jgi:hypothetical protein